MKPILFYDTETNGLPLWNQLSEHPNQPHITQLAAELFDADSGRVLAFVDLLIHPEDWTIPPELEALTGITNELVQRFGHPMDDALRTFMQMWCEADLRVAHNESFDQRMVRIEALRTLGEKHGFHEDWKNGATFCTQANSIKILNLPPTPKMVAAGRTHAKSPNLGEAYEFFTGTKLEGAHNAAVDLAACKAVYFGIQAFTRQAA
ncbi:3'-5' exonuclease [Paraburkholderia madseniana]|uniref:3'-5' exonuclease n=1 Tax=Paraburkholderia madseniana TaxID=2599607 RepID=A0A6N6WC70_9BURK|nr:3'-5' exonuclease [Paraburkholderia madseniana]KAE8757354.1 3'-5' exonuclease [Paraburkholderia madseniana]